METCRTCVHWRKEDPGSHMTDPVDPDTWEPMQFEFEVRACTHPKLLFCERPLEDDGFAVCDGSTYMAGLFTAENFGCVRHSTLVTDRERDEADEQMRNEIERVEEVARTLYQTATPERWVHQLRSPDGEVLAEASADAGERISLRPTAGTRSPIEYWVDRGSGFRKEYETPMSRR